MPQDQGQKTPIFQTPTKRKDPMLPTNPNPRRFTATTKLTESTYLSLVNEAQRRDVTLSTVVHQVIERGVKEQL